MHDFSRLRRAEIIHHHIAGAYLLRYAQESSWREDNRKVSNGDQVNRIAGLALKRSKVWISRILAAACQRLMLAGYTFIYFENVNTTSPPTRLLGRPGSVLIYLR